MDVNHKPEPLLNNIYQKDGCYCYKISEGEVLAHFPRFKEEAKRSMLLGNSKHRNNVSVLEQFSYRFQWRIKKKKGSEDLYTKINKALEDFKLKIDDVPDDKWEEIIKNNIDIEIVAFYEHWKFPQNVKNIPKFVVDFYKEEIKNNKNTENVDNIENTTFSMAA